jgi:hypothetical protein
MLALLLAASVGADPQPFAVTNKCEATFVVTNRTLDVRPAYLPACITCSPCACKPGICPACPAAKAIHVSPDGAVNELGADGVYRPIPGEPKRKPVAAPVPAAPVPAAPPLSFAPYSLAPICPPGSRG